MESTLCGFAAVLALGDKLAGGGAARALGRGAGGSLCEGAGCSLPPCPRHAALSPAHLWVVPTVTLLPALDHTVTTVTPARGHPPAPPPGGQQPAHGAGGAGGELHVGWLETKTAGGCHEVWTIGTLGAGVRGVVGSTKTVANLAISQSNRLVKWIAYLMGEGKGRHSLRDRSGIALEGDDPRVETFVDTGPVDLVGGECTRG